MLRDADFEVALRWRGDGSFDVSLGYDDPNDVAAKRQYGVKLIVIDLGPLSLLLADQRAYGERLTEVLFAADDTVATFDSKAKAVAENQDIPLHFRLYVDPAAPSNYLRVRWELLRDPEDNSVIATKRNCLFSRFLSHADWRALAPPKKHDLRALVAIANGRNLGEYTPRHSSLPQVDVNGELARARDALSDTRLIELASDGKATLEQIVDALEMGVDILYLVCHGSIVGGRSVLYLERADGSVHPAFGDELATRIADLRRRPTLAVLCSCNSAGPGEEGMTSDNGDLVPLGPSLAASGVAAVVAMQGNVTIQTAGAFLTAFFKALKHDGVVDRAATVARAAVSNRPDWWMPVLFSRLKRGRTYYLPEFAERGDVTWKALIPSIAAKRCTPVIGPSLAATVIGSRREVAQRWVQRYGMPIAESSREDLTTVAQYLQVRSARHVPANELRTYLLAHLRERFKDDLPPALLETGEIEQLIAARGSQLRARVENEPHNRLASLDLPIYITTSWTDLLEAALTDGGREPTSMVFDWYSVLDTPDVATVEPPTKQRPLVYHLFGRLDEPESRALGGRPLQLADSMDLKARDRVPAFIGSPKPLPASVNEGPGHGQTARQPSW